MKVKFTNLYKLIPQKKKINKKIQLLIKKANFVGGEEVRLFEKNFAKFVGAKNCITVGNGTDALEIAIKSLNLKRGSEVIVPNNTWISTAEAVIANGLNVKFCDVNLDDYSICLNDLKKKINKKTKAIIAVHLYGNPTNITEIKKIIKNKKIKVIEDCAQAHGAKLKKKHVGTLGDISTFSFFPGKNLGAFGDAGAIVTNLKQLSINCLRSRNHGAIKKYDHLFSGRNSRLDTINAAVLNIKLFHYKTVIKKRNQIAKIYFKELKNISNLKLSKLSDENSHSFHQFVIRTNYRDKLRAFLNNKGVETMVHYPYMLNELKFFKNKMNLIKSKNLGKKILSLPISEEHTKKEILYVCKMIQNFFEKI
jgi:dTDP-4-amino-4,6-dideoxygalactose transaminase